METKSEKRKAKNKSTKIFPELFYFTFYTVILHFSFYALHLPHARAATMQNDNYSIEKRKAEIGPLKMPTPTPKPEEKPFASGKNYTVEANTSPFIFSVSHNYLNFGTLTATNPVIRLLYLTTTGKTAYQILAAQNYPLSDDNKIIPDTTCDNGSCTEETDSAWISALTYGLGFQTKNMREDNYRQFADLSKNEQPEVIFLYNNGNNLQDKIIYKVNISTTQQPGMYNNVVTYIATPSF